MKDLHERGVANHLDLESCCHALLRANPGDVKPLSREQLLRLVCGAMATPDGPSAAAKGELVEPARIPVAAPCNCALKDTPANRMPIELFLRDSLYEAIFEVDGKRRSIGLPLRISTWFRCDPDRGSYNARHVAGRRKRPPPVATLTSPSRSRSTNCSLPSRNTGANPLRLGC